MLRYLLFLRFVLANGLFGALVALVYSKGWLDAALSGYTAWLCAAIVALFAYGMVIGAARIWRVSRELNDVRAQRPRPGSRAGNYLDAVAACRDSGRPLVANLLRLRMAAYVGGLRHLANALVLLGLIGTVIGFIIALSGVDPEASVAVEQVAPMVATLISGMSIALYTTLLGAVLHLWTMHNHRLLTVGSMHLFNAIVELGERRVGSG